MSKKLSKDLRDSTVAELKKEGLSLVKDEFKLRMQKATGQLAKPHLMKLTRRRLARVKTLLTEKNSIEKGVKA